MIVFIVVNLELNVKTVGDVQAVPPRSSRFPSYCGSLTSQLTLECICQPERLGLTGENSSSGSALSSVIIPIFLNRLYSLSFLLLVRLSSVGVVSLSVVSSEEELLAGLRSLLPGISLDGMIG